MTTLSSRLYRLATPAANDFSSLEQAFKDSGMMGVQGPLYKEAALELWEKYAPPEWQDGHCPHHGMVGVGSKPFPFGLQPNELRWVLGNVKALKETELVLQEYAHRQHTLYEAFAKWSDEEGDVPTAPEVFVWLSARAEVHFANPTLEWLCEVYGTENDDMTDANPFMRVVDRIRSSRDTIFKNRGIANYTATLCRTLSALLEKPAERMDLFNQLRYAYAGTDSEGEQLPVGTDVQMAFERDYPMLSWFSVDKRSFKCPLTPLVELTERTGIVCAQILPRWNEGEVELFFPSM